MTTPARPLEALRHTDFRQLWLGQLVSITGTQMQTAAINWHVYQLSQSPLALGAVGLTRVVPIVIFSLWGGILADRGDRRRVMLFTQSAMMLAALTLAVLTRMGRDSLALLYLLNALSATAVAFDGPARQSLLPRLVPLRDLAGALSLGLTAFHFGMIAGPALSGFVIAGAGEQVKSGLSVIYFVNAASFLGVLVALLAMNRETGRVRSAEVTAESPLQSLRAGLRFVFSTPLLVWSMVLDFFATFFSGALTLLPIFADQILHVGPKGYGVLAAAPAVGALVGSFYTSVFPLPVRQGPVFLWAVAAYGAATVVFGLSRSFLLTALALAATGLADLVSTVIRQTMRQIITPDELRGRMTSINMIFFMGGPQLGEFEAGLVAALFASAATGVTVSVVSGGLATLAVAAVVAWATPVVRRYVHAPEAR